MGISILVKAEQHAVRPAVHRTTEANDGRGGVGLRPYYTISRAWLTATHSVGPAASSSS